MQNPRDFMVSVKMLEEQEKIEIWGISECHRGVWVKGKGMGLDWYEKKVMIYLGGIFSWQCIYKFTSMLYTSYISVGKDSYFGKTLQIVYNGYSKINLRYIKGNISLHLFGNLHISKKSFTRKITIERH